MENCYAIRITHPYAAISDVMRLWERYCRRLVCYEHNDDGANNIHCHVHIEGVTVTKKRLQQMANQLVPMTRAVQGKRATSLMSFRGNYDGHPIGFAYLTKGKYLASYIAGSVWYEEAERLQQEWKDLWRDPKDYRKRNPWEELYDSFELTIPIKPPPTQAEMDEWLVRTDDTPPPNTKWAFREILIRANRYILDLNNRVFTPQFKSQRNCVLFTYCYRNKIAIRTHEYRENELIFELN